MIHFIIFNLNIFDNFKNLEKILMDYQYGQKDFIKRSNDQKLIRKFAFKTKSF